MASKTELANWLNGTATGGPNGDGTYPLTRADGTVHYIKCPAAESVSSADEVSLPQWYADQAAASAAAAAQSAAEAANDLTLLGQHEQNAAASASAAANSATAAASSASAANSSKTAAATSATNAANSASAASSSASNAASRATSAANSATAAANSATAAANSASDAASYAASLDTANIVHRSGDETITGTKTFNGIVNAANLTAASGYLNIKPYNASYDDGSYIQSYYDGNNRQFRLLGRDSAGSGFRVGIYAGDLDVAAVSATSGTFSTLTTGPSGAEGQYKFGVDDWYFFSNPNNMGWYSTANGYGIRLAKATKQVSVWGGLDVGGYGVWHSGNFNPANYVLVNPATLNDAALDTLDGAGFFGWAATGIDGCGLQMWSSGQRTQIRSTLQGELQFRTDDTAGAASWGGEAWRTIWHSGNFDPNAKLDKTPTVIGASQDLDTYTTQGVYYQTYSANTSAALHYPINVAGLLEVFSQGSSFVEQRYTAYNGNGIYKRAKYSSNAWTPWELFWTSGNFTPSSKLTDLGSITSDVYSITESCVYSTAGSANAPANYAAVLHLSRGPTRAGRLAIDSIGSVSRGWISTKGAGGEAGWRELATFESDGSLSAPRMFSGYDSGVTNSISCSNWFRTTGNTGLYCSTYGGGVYMTDTTYLRSYNNKAMLASDFVISSDRALKTGIRPLEYKGRLTPRSYVYKADGRADIGFIAQEVEELYPELVSKAGRNGTLKLSYGKLTAVLSHQINALEDLVLRQQEQIDALSRPWWKCLFQSIRSIA